MLTTMGIKARTLNVDIAGATAVVEKEMTSSGPRTIQRLTVRIHVPHVVSPEHREQLEHAAHGCPVCRSLGPDVQTPVEITWG
jgi:putative redox protein